MPFVIPTTYTAVDKYTSVVNKMKAGAQGFANAAQAGVSRLERGYRKLTPALGEAQKNILQNFKAVAIAGALIGGLTFSVSSLKDYETAVQSFRTIVSDLTDQEFAKYQSTIIQVAKDTKKSSIETAEAFEKVAGLNAKFAETAEGIGAVSSAAITLSKASREDLGASAESLVGIMNQFSFAADQADRTINVLAAGTAVGASSIAQTSEAFVNFGAIASSANITLEESVGLVQTLGKFSIFGSEAGNKLKGSILRIQKAGIGYKSGLFNINDALTEAKAKTDKLKTAKQKDAFLTKLFGAENISTGRILLANIDTYKEFTKGVTGTTAAQKAAEINSASLTVRLDQLKNSWVNLITGSDQAGSALGTASGIVVFLTNNLGTIVSVGSKILLFFVAWKALIIVTNIALGAYNIVLGVTGALSGTASIAIGKNAIALGAYNVVTWLATAATTAFTTVLAVLTAPITLIILAVAALVAVVVLIINKWNEWGAALSILLGPLGLVISLIQSFRRNWDGITNSFKEGGIIAGFKAIGATILDAVLMPLQMVFQLLSNIPGVGKYAQKAVDGIEQFRKNIGVNVTTDESGAPLAKNELVNPEVSRQESLKQTINTQKQNVAIDIRDRSGSASVSSDNSFVPISLRSSMKFAR